MKYLSDLLYVDIPTSLFEGEYRTFEVKMICPNFAGSSFDDTLTYEEQYETIYVGKIYGTGNTERIYLNDIVSTHVYNNSYIYDHLYKDDTGDFIYTTPKGVLFMIRVYVVDMFSKDVDATPYIMNYFKDAKTLAYNNIEALDDTFIPRNYNLLNQRTFVYPRIPKLPYPTEKFWFSGLFAANMAWVADNKNASGNNIFFVVASKNNQINKSYSVQPTKNTSLINAVTIKGDKYYDIVSHSDRVMFAGWIARPDSEYLSLSPIADVDECPAPYYLIWIDRTGAYQSQPFRGKTTLSESISTNYRYDMIDREIPIDKKVTNKWTLNSEWLNYEQYKAYESIFTSKFLYLFNTEYDEGYEVVLDTNEWIEKTKDNRDKLFNLQLELHEGRPQNIIY